MFTKTLSAMITAAALSFGGAAFASTPAPSTTNTVTTTAKTEQKVSTHKHVKKVAVAKSAKAPVKMQPRTPAKKNLRTGKKVVRASRTSVKPVAK